MSHGHPGAARRPAKLTQPVGKTLKELNYFIRPYRWAFLISLLFFAVAVTANVVAPKILGNATNIIVDGFIGKMIPKGMTAQQMIAHLRATGHNHIADLMSSTKAVAGQGVDFTALAHILLFLVGLYLVVALTQWAGGAIARAAIQRIGWRMRRAIEAKVDTLPLSYLDQQSRGDLMSRVTNDVDNITQSTQQSITQIFTAILTVIGITAMMLSLSWKLTIAALIAIPLGAIAAGFLMKKASPHFKKQWSATGSVGGIVEDSFSGHNVAAAFNMQEQLTAEFKRANDELYQATRKSQFFSGLVQPAMTVTSNLSYVVVAIFGGLQVTNGQLTIGGVQAFLQYSRQFNQPISTLAAVANQIQSGLASAERVFQFLEQPQVAPDASGKLPENVHGNIRFEHVRFGYDPNKPVITDLSLDVKAGQTIAIVGPTGAGKTTLVNLLMRFYEIDAGHIYFDGVDTRTVSKANLRSKFGMVLQDTWLFEGTVADNIAYGAAASQRPVSRERVIEAARATSVDHMIRTLPQGYDTVIGEESGISQGQKQLLTIARAFIADPPVLILDEATSSVDTSTELAVQKATRRLRQGRTAFIIAHRLSTIRDADTIVVMEHGDVVESGKHEELLAKNGAYARLYHSQFVRVEDN